MIFDGLQEHLHNHGFLQDREVDATVKMHDAIATEYEEKEVEVVEWSKTNGNEWKRTAVSGLSQGNHCDDAPTNIHDKLIRYHHDYLRSTGMIKDAEFNATVQMHNAEIDNSAAIRLAD